MHLCYSIVSPSLPFPCPLYQAKHQCFVQYTFDLPPVPGPALLVLSVRRYPVPCTRLYQIMCHCYSKSPISYHYTKRCIKKNHLYFSPCTRQCTVATPSHLYLVPCTRLYTVVTSGCMYLAPCIMQVIFFTLCLELSHVPGNALSLFPVSISWCLYQAMHLLFSVSCSCPLYQAMHRCYSQLSISCPLHQAMYS